MNKDRTVRDIIDDIMVRFEMLDKELGILSRNNPENRGRIARVKYWMDEIEDLLIELKAATNREPFQQ